jgi:hypothetical protein
VLTSVLYAAGMQMNARYPFPLFFFGGGGALVALTHDKWSAAGKKKLMTPSDSDIHFHNRAINTDKEKEE